MTEGDKKYQPPQEKIKRTEEMMTETEANMSKSREYLFNFLSSTNPNRMHKLIEQDQDFMERRANSIPADHPAVIEVLKSCGEKNMPRDFKEAVVLAKKYAELSKKGEYDAIYRMRDALPGERAMNLMGTEGLFASSVDVISGGINPQKIVEALNYGIVDTRDPHYIFECRQVAEKYSLQDVVKFPFPKGKLVFPRYLIGSATIGFSWEDESSVRVSMTSKNVFKMRHPNAHVSDEDFKEARRLNEIILNERNLGLTAAEINAEEERMASIVARNEKMAAIVKEINDLYYNELYPLFDKKNYDEIEAEDLRKEIKMKEEELRNFKAENN